jgi:ketosteroid isomerase-like protein
MVLTSLVSLTGCQQTKPEQSAALTAEDIAAIGQTSASIQAYQAKDIARYMSHYTADAVFSEYDRYNARANDKPEFEEGTVATYKAVDRVVRGRNGIVYVSERNILDFQIKDGKRLSTDSARASNVLANGFWKFVQSHWSGR